MTWWIRPLVRLIAAVALPLIVPAVITGILWALPGDPVEILCPPGICTGQEELAQRWHMDAGPIGFYTHWLANAFTGDFGRSIRVMQGQTVDTLLMESIMPTLWLVLAALLPVVVLSAVSAANRISARFDPAWQLIGLVPSVLFALLACALLEINQSWFKSVFDPVHEAGWSGLSVVLAWVPQALQFLVPVPATDGSMSALRIAFGAVVLGLADGALSGAVTGTRSVFEEETKQRYVQIAVLRGEGILGNMLPNVMPALIGQFRGRMLHLLSGAVVVEVVLGIPGLGQLLWDGTLLQDFFVVLAAAWAFSLLSGVLLLIQAATEVLVEMHIRRSPVVPVAA